MSRVGKDVRAEYAGEEKQAVDALKKEVRDGGSRFYSDQRRETSWA